MNGCRQNGSSDKGNTIIHTTPVHQWTTCEVKSCMFVTNKSIKTFFFKFELLPAKINVLMLLYPVKKPSCQALFASQISSKQICQWILMWEDRLFHWMKNYSCFYWLWTVHLDWSNSLKLNALIMQLCLINMHIFSLQDVNSWAGVVLISCGLLWCF